jgi:hypothetical protein
LVCSSHSFFAKRKLLTAMFILCTWQRQLTTWRCCDTTCALQIDNVIIRPHMSIKCWVGNFLKQLVCSPITNKTDKQWEITGFIFIIKQKISHWLTNKKTLRTIILFITTSNTINYINGFQLVVVII